MLCFITCLITWHPLYVKSNSHHTHKSIAQPKEMVEQSVKVAYDSNIIADIGECLLQSFRIFLWHLLKSTTTQRCSRLKHRYCVGVNMPKCYRQLRVKDLTKVPRWWLEWDLSLRSSGRRTPNLPLNHHTPLLGSTSSVHKQEQFDSLFRVKI